MISAEEMLKPLSGESPCGQDLSYDPEFQELEPLMRGKPETQFAPAEDPDWRALRTRCLDLFEKSKDLRVATALCLAVLKTGGLAEFSQALLLLKGLLEQYWDPVHPILDPSDNNDPTQRVNIIAALATPVGTFGDPMRLLERLREVPLTNSAQLGRFGLAKILQAEAGNEGADNPVSASQIEGAFRDTSPDDLVAYHQAVTECIDTVRTIDDFLTRTVGSDHAPDLGLLPAELKEIQKRLRPYLPAGTAPAEEASPGEAGTAGAGGDASAAAARQAISGEITSREDVLRTIDKICDYYGRTEPSSPVPYVLRRARRLAEMDFMQIMNDMSPDALTEIRRITGEPAPQ